jgi:hypothetical protein
MNDQINNPRETTPGAPAQTAQTGQSDANLGNVGQEAQSNPSTPAPAKKKETRGRKKGVGRWAGGSKNGGRPSSYQPQYSAMIYECGLAGMTDVRISRFFNVSQATLYAWFKRHPELKRSLENGRERATMQVAHAMFKRAVGCSVPDTWVGVVKGEIRTKQLVRHFPPDVSAAKFWLATKAADMGWVEKMATEVTGPGGSPLAPSVIVISREEVAAPAQPAIDLPPSAVTVAPAQPGGAATISGSNETSPQARREPVTEIPERSTAPNAPQAKTERNPGGVAQQAKAALPAGVAEDLLAKLVALQSPKPPAPQEAVAPALPAKATGGNG